MALDTEWNYGYPPSKNLLCRISIINDLGEIVLDTLVSHRNNEIRSSQFKLHGIPDSLLLDAPAFHEV